MTHNSDDLDILHALEFALNKFLNKLRNDAGDADKFGYVLLLLTPERNGQREVGMASNMEPDSAKTIIQAVAARETTDDRREQ